MAVTKFGKMETRRWAAFSFGALRSMHRGYVVVVYALHAMKPGDAQDNLKQHELLYLITDYMFVAALHFMLDVAGVCAGMSQTMQFRRRCIALEDLTINRCTETLARVDRWEGRGGALSNRNLMHPLLCHAFWVFPYKAPRIDFPSQAGNFLHQLKKKHPLG